MFTIEIARTERGSGALSVFARYGSMGFRPKWSTPRDDDSETPDEKEAGESCLAGSVMPDGAKRL
jgi:hypothetical protein